MSSKWTFPVVATLGASVTLWLSGCSWGTMRTQNETLLRGAVGNVMTMSQGWTAQEREAFYFTSQGSQLCPYDWFLALEQAESTNLFRADANMERFRWLPARPTSLNPDGLPVGFARDVDGRTKQEWVGLNCAACHTTQIHYQDFKVRVDGGPAMADAQGFLAELGNALQHTLGSPAKFDRFAHRVLGGRYDESRARELRMEVRSVRRYIVRRVERNATVHPYGFARLDAFGNILNEVLAYGLQVPENQRTPDAPVSFPFLWDTAQSDVVQWNGSVANAPSGLGPLARNVGEVLGVFAKLDITPDQVPLGYSSSAQLVNLAKLEKWAADLWSPVWPEPGLPPIDHALASKGQVRYNELCLNCHQLIDRTNPNRRIAAKMVRVDEVGTDPTMAMNFFSRTAQTGRLAGTPEGVFLGPDFGTNAPAGAILRNVGLGVIMRHPGKALLAAIDDHLKVGKAPPFDLRSYKARPLNGIWATAPYLHNGSVPNLWQLLQSPSQRAIEFSVGSREFDPVNVGFKTESLPDGFKFDTRVPGNSNAGHEYGTTLTDAEKWELIEFLKTL